MANVLFTRTSDPNSKPVTDGQLIFDTSGNGKMYLDNGTDRLEMGGALTVDATLSKTSTNPVQNKAVAGVMLDTLSDISNVTSKGFLADALAVKELNNNLSNINIFNTTPIYTNSNADSSTTYTANEDCLMTYNLYSYGGTSRLLVNGIVRAIVTDGSKTQANNNINSINLCKGDVVTFTTVGTKGTDFLIQFGIYTK